jgi:hypothetical protein
VPTEALRHADAVVIGEAELVMPQLLADAAAGSLEPLYSGDRPDMADVPTIAEYGRFYTSGRYGVSRCTASRSRAVVASTATSAR